MIDRDIFNKDIEFSGAKGLIFIGDKIIVCRRDNKTERFPLQVDLPGGAREIGESPFETFQREVKEELDLDINEKDVQYAKKHPSIFSKSKFAYFIVVKSDNFKEKDITFGNEGLYYSLMLPEEFMNLRDGIKQQQKKVADYLHFISQ